VCAAIVSKNIMQRDMKSLMSSREMVRISNPGPMLNTMCCRGSLLEIVRFDLFGPVKSHICGVDGPKKTKPAFNGEVYKPDGNKVELLSYMKPGRPLVMCIGALIT